MTNKITMILVFILGLSIGSSIPAFRTLYGALKGDSYFGERMTDYYGHWRYNGQGWVEEWVFTVLYFTESAKNKRSPTGERLLPSCDP